MVSASWVLLSVFATTLLIAVAATWLVRRLALTQGMIDRPNERSSHAVPTPRGGGLAIAFVLSFGVILLLGLRVIDFALAFALLIGGIAVAWIGFMDDRDSMRVGSRLLVHFGAAASGMCMLGGLPVIQFGTSILNFGLAGDIVGTIAIVWALNLFNFMDGIDGIAASEATFVSGAGALIAFLNGASHALPTAGLITCAASMGFLVWNWPRAKIFMGDVGSGYLGYVIAILALGHARESSVALYVWVVLGGLFLVDASVTLLRRLLRGERFHQAHRTHAYQWLARRWQSHKRVTLLAWSINLVWLLPIAWLCTVYPTRAAWFLVLSILPLVPLALLAGAGRIELSKGTTSDIT